MPKKSETKRTPRRSSRPAVRGNKTQPGPPEGVRVPGATPRRTPYGHGGVGNGLPLAAKPAFAALQVRMMNLSGLAPRRNGKAHERTSFRRKKREGRALPHTDSPRAACSQSRGPTLYHAYPVRFALSSGSGIRTATSFLRRRCA